MIESLMANPYAWAILSLSTIISLLFGIYTWIVGHKSKEISIDYYTNQIIKQGKTPISKLSIKFDDKTIQDLSSSIFYIWNSGNDVIRDNDIVKARPLGIKSKRENILDIQILKQSDISNAFTINTISQTNTIILFDYINSNEGVKIQILHTGQIDDLSIDCKIKGGKEIRDCTKIRKDKGTIGLLKDFEREVMPMLVFLVGGILSIIVLGKFGFMYQEHKTVVLIISMGFSIVTIVLYANMKRKIRQAFHRVIPNNLKDENKI